MWKKPECARLEQVVTNFFCNEERFLVKYLSSPEEIERCVQLVIENDKIIRALNMLTDEVSMVSFRNWLQRHLSQEIAYGCYLMPEKTRKINPLVAVDVLYVRNFRDDYPTLGDDSGQSFLQFMKYIRLIERNIRYYQPKTANASNYLTSYGIITAPGYENCQIQKNMLNLRKNVAREILIENFGSAFLSLTHVVKKPFNMIKIINRTDLQDSGVDFSTDDLFPIQILGCEFKSKETVLRSGVKKEREQAISLI